MNPVKFLRTCGNPGWQTVVNSVSDEASLQFTARAAKVKVERTIAWGVNVYMEQVELDEIDTI